MKLTSILLATIIGILAVALPQSHAEEAPLGEPPANLLMEEFKALTDMQLVERLGDPGIIRGSLELLLDELLTRDSLPRYPMEIKRAMQRRMIRGDLASVAKIAAYRGFCAAAFPELTIDFAGDYTPQTEAERQAWTDICQACPRKGLNFQRLCERTTAAPQE